MWQPFYAWYPVVTLNASIVPRIAWRRYVERKLHAEVSPNGDLTEWWEYREVGDE